VRHRDIKKQHILYTEYFHSGFLSRRHPMGLSRNDSSPWATNFRRP